MHLLLLLIVEWDHSNWLLPLMRVAILRWIQLLGMRLMALMLASTSLIPRWWGRRRGNAVVAEIVHPGDGYWTSTKGCEARDVLSNQRRERGLWTATGGPPWMEQELQLTFALSRRRTIGRRTCFL